MKNNKGFSMVELIAVIALISLLLVTVAPNVIKTFQESKKRSFLSEVREVCRSATNTYVRGSVMALDGAEYYKLEGTTTNQLGLSGRSEFHYYVKVDNYGKVIGLKAWDLKYSYSKKDANGFDPNDISLNDIKEYQNNSEVLSQIRNEMSI